jgi:hypothetical protein
MGDLCDKSDGREALRQQLPMGAPAGLRQRHAQPDARAAVDAGAAARWQDSSEDTASEEQEIMQRLSHLQASRAAAASAGAWRQARSLLKSLSLSWLYIVDILIK